MKSGCDISGNFRDLYRLAEDLKIPERRIIDFSTPSNPLGISKKIKADLRKHLKYLHSYPDEEAKRLRNRLARHNAIEPETILCGNGSTALVYLLARALRPLKVIIPVPTFSIYERACYTCCDSEIIYCRLKGENNFDIDPREFIKTMEENLPVEQRQNVNFPVSGSPPFPSFNMVFLCNPNNPTGRLVKKDSIKEISDAAGRIGCYLVVDEAFIDFCPADSVIKDVAESTKLIVLRSMSPFYALPGLRFGYGVFPRQLAAGLKEYKEPWTVNGLAQRAAMAALKDEAYRRETFRAIQDEKKYLEKNFRKMGIEFLTSAANFYLVKTDNAGEICRQLQKKGILLSGGAHFSGLDSAHIRIAVKSHRENSILIKELKKIFGLGNGQHAV